MKKLVESNSVPFDSKYPIQRILQYISSLPDEYLWLIETRLKISSTGGRTEMPVYEFL